LHFEAKAALQKNPEKKEGDISAPSETCKDIETDTAEEAASTYMTDADAIVAFKTKKNMPSCSKGPKTPMHFIKQMLECPFKFTSNEQGEL
jgi:hypothetical protein